MNDFDGYPCNAIYTWGDKEDFKYFLPRMLELNVYIELYDADIYLLSSLEHSNWPQWSDVEKNIFLDFCVCYFYNFLANFKFHDASKWGSFLSAMNKKFNINFDFNVVFIKRILKKFLTSHTPNNDTGDSLNDFFSIVKQLFNTDDVSTILMTFEKEDWLHLAFFFQNYSYYNNRGMVLEKSLLWALEYLEFLEEAFLDKKNENHADIISRTEDILRLFIKIA